MSESASPEALTHDDRVSVLVSYTGTTATSMSYSPVSQHSPAHDDAMYSEEEAEEMMQFVERYSSVEPDDPESAEDEIALSDRPTASTNIEYAGSEHAHDLTDDMLAAVNDDFETNDSAAIDYYAARSVLSAPYPLAEHLIIRRAVWKREQEEAEDESRVEESLFTPGADLEGDDHGFGEATGEATVHDELSSPVRGSDDSVDSGLDLGKRWTKDRIATPRFAKSSKITESPFHLKPVETTPDKRRLAWELGLGAESSPGSGFYLAQVKSAVAGRWVDEF